MHPVIQKTFGGLAPSYYFRHLFFGAIFPAIFMAMSMRRPGHAPMGLYALLAVNTLLYPYARFVYEGIVGFIMGNNIFVVPVFLMLFVKLMSMALCWGAAVFIAPIGLLYLYFRHGRAANA